MSTGLEHVLIEETKILGYLLAEDHPDGKSKAAFFLSFGFTIQNWTMLVDALRHHAANNPIKQKVESTHGVKYVIEGGIPTPDGRNPSIRSVWIQEVGQSIPRLVTAYPSGGRI
jgi:hypothetical protein